MENRYLTKALLKLKKYYFFNGINVDGHNSTLSITIAVNPMSVLVSCHSSNFLIMDALTVGKIPLDHLHVL